MEHLDMNENMNMEHRSCSDEPVPSRYVMRVGEIEVVVISDGIIWIPAEAMATNADPGVRSNWLEDRFLPQDNLDWALNAFVVHSGAQTILIDSGLGGEYSGYPKAGHFVQRLAAAGIDLASVTDVVLTHMHFDHVGGLLVDGVKEQLRSDLRVHVSAAEVEFWKSPDFTRTAIPSEFADVIRRASSAFLERYRDHLCIFDEEQQVAPGVVVTRTGGHTPGHSVVRIASDGAKLMFAGDAILPASFDHPEWHNGFEHDPEEATCVRLRLMRELATTGSLLVSTHMPFPSAGHVATEGELFRWVPSWWNY